MEGETLRQRLGHGPLPLLEALDITIAVATALGAAHEVWIVHRDVKPENIMIRRDRLVKVLDFSVATLLARTVPLDPLRQRVEIAGTLAYLSPEQIRGDLVDNRSDLFSLGVVLYEMLTGTVPFHGPTTVELLAAIVESAPPPIGDHFPAALQRIVDRMLEKPVHLRYQTAGDLIEDLRSLSERVADAMVMR